MYRINPDIDIIKDLLEAVIKAQPESVFANSLYHQYQERGGLSKKQLEGLYSKASKIKDISAGKLATLQAIILKRPTRFKSEKPEVVPLPPKDETPGRDMEAILQKFPQHKRVLFLKSKWDKNEAISAQELSEIARFKGILLK